MLSPDSPCTITRRVEGRQLDLRFEIGHPGHAPEWRTVSFKVKERRPDGEPHMMASLYLSFRLLFMVAHLGECRCVQRCNVQVSLTGSRG